MIYVWESWVTWMQGKGTPVCFLISEKMGVEVLARFHDLPYDEVKWCGMEEEVACWCCRSWAQAQPGLTLPSTRTPSKTCGQPVPPLYNEELRPIISKAPSYLQRVSSSLWFDKGLGPRSLLITPLSRIVFDELSVCTQWLKKGKIKHSIDFCQKSVFEKKILTVFKTPQTF